MISGHCELLLHSPVDGNPAPLSAAEVEEMVAWTVEADTEFSEAVVFRLQGPAPDSNHRFVYTTLADSAIPQNHSVTLANLLAWLLRGEKSLPHDFDEIHSMARSVAGIVRNRTQMVAICNHLMRLGDLGATKLKSKFE
jgi:hypothetical protein